MSEPTQDAEYRRGYTDGAMKRAEVYINVVKMYCLLGFNRATCKCGRTIWWGKTKAGKPIPLNDDATSHFSDCPMADKFRRTT